MDNNLNITLYHKSLIGFNRRISAKIGSFPATIGGFLVPSGGFPVTSRGFLAYSRGFLAIDADGV